MTRMACGRRPVLGGALAIVLCAGVAMRAETAQPSATPDARWQPWLGCWTPTDFAATVAGHQTCVVPAPSSSGVDILSIDSRQVLSREHVEATGERRRTESNGCVGWERTEWSTDGRRVYLTAETTCTNGAARRSSGIFGLSASGDWVHVAGLSVSGHTAVTVIARRPSLFRPALPDVAAALQAIDRSAVQAARVGASGPLSLADIIETSRHADTPVVETWLATSRQPLTIGARHLVELSEAKVPDRVIDMVVALSYPEAFAIGPPATGGGSPTVVGASPPSDVWLAACSPYSGGLSLAGWCSLSTYGWLYGDLSAQPGISPYVGPAIGWYGGAQPLVIIRTPQGSGDASHGRVISGRGYVAGSGGTSGPAGAAGATATTGTPGTTGAAAPADGSGAPATGGASSGGSSSGGGERTAKPR